MVAQAILLKEWWGWPQPSYLVTESGECASPSSKALVVVAQALLLRDWCWWPQPSYLGTGGGYPSPPTEGLEVVLGD